MEKMPKNAEKFSCEKCNFICSKKSNFEMHLLTSKHKNRTELNVLEPTLAKTRKNILDERKFGNEKYHIQGSRI